MTDKNCRYLVLGAGGKTGRLVVQELVAKVHNVTALYRAEASAPKMLKGTEQVLGDANNPALLEKLLLNCDVCISCLGHTRNSGKRVQATLASVAASLGKNAPRIILQTGIGLMAAPLKSPIHWSLTQALKIVDPARIEDAETAVSLLRASDIQWSALCCPLLTNGTGPTYTLPKQVTLLHPLFVTRKACACALIALAKEKDPQELVAIA